MRFALLYYLAEPRQRSYRSQHPIRLSAGKRAASAPADLRWGSAGRVGRQWP